jgi:hypothetical protein
MEKFRKIVETTIINENGTEEKYKKITEHTIKKWNELSREEQDKEIEKHQEAIYCNYQDDMYENYKIGLDNLRYEFENIKFDDVYLDSNSQGWWIDSIKNFKYHCDNLIVYGEEIEIYDIDFHIRKLIETFDIDIYDYYIDSDKLEKIKATKKYQKWIDDIRNDIEKWVDCVNDLCSDVGNSEYKYPYNMDDEDDKYYLDMYFEDMEFETYEIVKEDE